MAQGTLWLQPIQHIFSAATVVPAAKAYFYLAGSSTPVNVFSDVGLTTAYTQPVVADSNGVFAEIFLTPGVAYKVDVQTSAGVSLTGYPADNQLAIPASSATVDTTETAGEALTAGLVAYLSDGSGGKNAGQLYKADSSNPYSSTLAVIGMVPSAIASGATGTFRQGGQIAGLSVAAGTDYYVGAAGALTTTATGNARFVGRADSATSLLIQSPRPSVNPSVCQGRLTGTTATPVTSSDVTNITTIYFTPYTGNLIGLFDGTNWSTYVFSEISLALGTLTSGLPYDVFVYNNAGTLTLELTAWSNTTTRVTALVFQNGIYVKTGATTRRYLGTIYTTSTTQTQDTATQRYVWNYYNRVRRPLLRQESTASWTYTTATWRQANGSASNQVEVVIGAQEATLDLSVATAISNGTGGISGAIGVGEDSTSTPLDTGVGGFAQSNATNSAYVPVVYSLGRQPAVGRHVYAWLEYSVATGTMTWAGAAGVTGQTHVGGIRGSIDG